MNRPKLTATCKIAWLAVLLLLSCSFVLSGQGEALSSTKLYQQLSEVSTDTARTRILRLLADEYRRKGDTDSLEFTINELLPYAEKNVPSLSSAQIWYAAEELYHRQGRLEDVQAAYDRSISYVTGCSDQACLDLRVKIEATYAAALNDKGQHQAAAKRLEGILTDYELADKQRVDLLIRLTRVYLELGDYDATLNRANEARALNETLEDPDTELSIIMVFISTNKYLGNYDRAIEFCREALVMARQIDKHSRLQHTLYLVANNYTDAGLRKEAIVLLEELQTISDKNLPDGYYADALIGMVRNFSFLDPPSAIPYVEEIKELLASDQRYRIIHIRMSMYAALREYYWAIGEMDQAVEYGQAQLDFVRQHLDSDTTEMVLFSLRELHKVQALAGQYEAAWNTLDTFHHLKMAMVERNQEEATARAAISMDLASNEQARREAEQATLLEQQASAARTRFFLWLLAGAALILGVLIWSYRRVQRDRLLIQEKNVLIEQSLTEKEVLLREIHHRVKNNLQIISSLLDKQARKSTDEAVRSLVREGQERIQSMALIHQNLYESDQLSGIDIHSYLQELSENIRKSQAANAEQVQIELNVAEEKLDIDTAIPVGLILNELITNCYKYAFVGQRAGTIQVDFNKSGEQYLLKVSDDGVGFHPEQRERKSRSLGLNLVNGLVRQLQGTIEWLAVERGTAVLVRF